MMEIGGVRCDDKMVLKYISNYNALDDEWCCLNFNNTKNHKQLQLLTPAMCHTFILLSPLSTSNHSNPSLLIAHQSK